MKFAFGVDVGGTTIKVGLFNQKQDLLETEVLQTNKTDDGKHILKEVAKLIKEILKNKNIKNEAVVGVGFGIPGPVVDNFVSWCPNIGMRNTDIESEFLFHLGFKTIVKATNDATAAAFGEYSLYPEEDNLVFLTLGTGVGGGIIIDGKIIEGVHGSAGELGHIQVEYENPQKCPCGLLGCLETTASIRGFQWVGENVLKENIPTKLTKADLKPKIIFKMSEEGDQGAIEIFNRVGDYLAKAIAKIAVIVDPEVVVIGGGISIGKTIIIKAIEKAYLKYSFHGTTAVKFRLAKLENDAGMFGANRLVWQQYENN